MNSEGRSLRPVLRLAIPALGGAFMAVLAGVLLGTSCTGPGPASGLNPHALQEAAEYSASRGGFSLLVRQGGRLVFEQHANGSTEQTPHKIYSGTKAFWAVATLVAAEDGLLRLDERASDTIGEWRDDPRRRDITIRELLNFTSGLDPNFHLHSRTVADRNAAALKTSMVATHGTRFTYGPSHGQVLCELLGRKLEPRGETPFRYLRRTVLDPLAIGETEYRRDQKGNPLVATGFKLTAREWAKFGALLLGRGTYQGKVVVPGRWIDELLRGSRANPSFGLGLWLNRNAAAPAARERDIEEMLERPWQQLDWNGVCLCRDAPVDLVAAIGSGYQRLFVIPSRGLVIVRMGENAPFSDAEFLRRVLQP